MSATVLSAANVNDIRDHNGRHQVPIVVLTAAGLAAVIAFTSVFFYFLSAVQEHRNQQQLYATFRGLVNPSSAVAPFIGGRIPLGAPVALLDGPTVGLRDVIVVQGTSSNQMASGPGHLVNSPLPGQFGDSVLIGRSVTAGAPFSGVLRMRTGTEFTVVTGQGSFHYVVVDRRVSGDAVPALPQSGSLLTLITSVGSQWWTHLTAGHVVFVDAALVGTAVTTPAGQTTRVPASAVEGSSDETAWPWIALWSLLLLGAVMGTASLAMRWGLRRSWLVTLPVVVVVFWQFSAELLRLLPNVY